VIEDTPTSRIRSAHQGYVELSGTAELPSDGVVVAPLTRRECTWFRYRIEKKGNKSWRTVERKTSEHPFLLGDETGVCVVNPVGAEVTPTYKDQWHGHGRRPGIGDIPRAAGDSLFGAFGDLTLGTGLFGGRYRYTEERIEPGDPVYAIGAFRTLDGYSDRPLRDEAIRELLSGWKKDREGLQRRFDLNRDGTIDSKEWDIARRTAAAEVDRQAQAFRPGPRTHILSLGEQRRPFILSAEPQSHLVKRYRLRSAASLAAFLIAGGICTWMLSTRFLGA
jgi:hypothetical protein